MSGGSTTERTRRVGARLGSFLARAIAAIVVLVTFAGLAFLVYRGQLDDGALLLYAGVILGYVLHATKRLV